MITSSDVVLPALPRIVNLPPKATTNPQRDLEAFHAIFKAKCKDLEIAVPSSVQRKRFVDIARAHCAAPYFTISSQALGAESAKKIVQYLAGAGNGFFHTLDISCNKLADYGSAALAWLIERDQSLTRLNCASNCIGADGGELLLHALTNNQHLTSIDLSTVPGVNRNKVGPRGASALAAAMLTNQVLASVNLSQNCIGPAGAASLAAAMPFNVSLTELSIASNSLSLDGAAVLADGLPRSAIEKLDLDRNALGDEGITVLAAAFPECEHLRVLSLAENKIGPKGAQSLGKTLELNNTSLRSLVLSLNTIKGAGADALASALRGCCEECALHNGDAEALLFATAQSNTLVSLHLARNELGDKDGASAAAAIKANKIKLLDLSSNCIGDIGGNHIAQQLAQNTSLNKLSLRGNYLHEDAGHSFAQALQLNCTLLKFDIEGNQFPHTVFKDITVSLTGNKQGHVATEVDRLWDEMDRMRVKELELFETEDRIQKVQEAADAAEDLLISNEERLNQSQATYTTVHTTAECKVQEELRISQKELKTMQQECEVERHELQFRNEQVEQEATRWSRQKNERNGNMDSKIDREIDLRKRAEKEIIKMQKELGQASSDADKVGVEEEEGLERAKMGHEKAVREANFQDQRLDEFISQLPRELQQQLAEQQAAQQEMDDEILPDKHRWENEADLGLDDEMRLPPSRHSRYSTPSALSSRGPSRPATANRKTDRGIFNAAE